MASTSSRSLEVGAAGGNAQFDGFSDFFEQLMGGAAGPGRAAAGGRAHRAGRRAAPPARGANLRHELEIPLQTAALGGTTEFYLNGEKIAVNIPPGVETGSKIRLRERGTAISCQWTAGRLDSPD